MTIGDVAGVTGIANQDRGESTGSPSLCLVTFCRIVWPDRLRGQGGIL